MRALFVSPLKESRSLPQRFLGVIAKSHERLFVSTDGHLGCVWIGSALSKHPSACLGYRPIELLRFRQDERITVTWE